jgi:hypothetical protein
VTDFDAADVAAMRKEGDLRGFLRDQLRAGRNRKVQQPEAKPPKPPGYQHGAWPAGARPPDPPPSRHTEADWQLALDRYRSGHGHDNDPCHCGGCTRPKETQ